jgi:hypothetical protein
MWGFFFGGVSFLFALRLSRMLRIKKMNYLNSESKDLFIDQDININYKKKPNLILKMSLIELILHATILILFV